MIPLPPLAGQWRPAEPPRGDPERPEYRRGHGRLLGLTRRGLLRRGLASVVVVPGGAVWPIGGQGIRLNDPVAPNGVFIDSSNMTVSVAAGLTNGTYGQAVATITCDGIDPAAASWAFLNGDSVFDTYGSGINRLFTVTPVSGQGKAAATVAAAGLLPARPEGHTITFLVTDGQRTCARQVVIPCAWVTPQTPYLYVGRGMAAAHPGVGYDHFGDLMPTLAAGGDGGELPAAIRGTTVVWMPDSDPDYYANDNGTRTDDYSTRFGIHGPIRMVSADPAGPRVRVGGAIGSVEGGSDMRGKGFFSTAHGDLYLRGFEVSLCRAGTPDADMTHGISGIRVNAATWGDFTGEDLDVHDCDNGIESGTGPKKTTLRRSEFRSCGGKTVSSGQTHPMYLDGSLVQLEDVLSYNSVTGHNCKTRAYAGTLLRCRLMDGAGGTSSQQLNIPNGGAYRVQDCTLQKGPNQQNPYCLGYAEDGDPHGDRDNTLLVVGGTIISEAAPNTRTGPPAGIIHWRTTGRNGAPSKVSTQGVSWWLRPANAAGSYPAAVKLHVGIIGGTVSPGTLDETGSTSLVLPPPLDFSDPGTPSSKAAAPGFYNAPYYYGTDIIESDFVQLKPDVLDPRVSAAAPAGTLIQTLRPYGSPAYAHAGANDPRINPFGAGGNTYGVSKAGEYFGGSADWPADGIFTVNATSDGLGMEIRKGPAMTAAGVQIAKFRCVSAGGTPVSWRQAVVVTP